MGLVPHLPPSSFPQAAGNSGFRWSSDEAENPGTPALSYNKDVCVDTGDTCSSSGPKEDLRLWVVTVRKLEWTNMGPTDRCMPPWENAS